MSSHPCINTEPSLCDNGKEEMARTSPLPSHSEAFVNAKMITDIPEEILVICLSYTGSSLHNARLTCKRFNQVIETFVNKMNVVPIENLEITLREENHFDILCNKKTLVVHESDLFKHIRFLNPKEFRIIRRSEALLTRFPFNNMSTSNFGESLSRGKFAMELLVFFPQINNVTIWPCHPITTMAQLSACMASIWKIVIISSTVNYFTLEDLITRTVETSKEIERLDILKSKVLMSAILRFVEEAKFAATFFLRVKVFGYGKFSLNDRNSPERELNEWKCRQESNGLLHQIDAQSFEFRSTLFKLELHREDFAGNSSDGDQNVINYLHPRGHQPV